MYEYKVITERDQRLSGNFDAASVEAMLNSYARDGWRVCEAMLAANVWKTMKAEIVIVLERQLDGSAAGIRAQ